MRQTILVISAVGAFLFGLAWLVSWLNPVLIERAAREIVRIEVERRVGEKVDALSSTRIAGLAQKLLRKNEQDIEQAQQALRQEIPQKVADIMALMQRTDCECRKRLTQRLHEAARLRLTSLQAVRDHLVVLVESAYASVSSSLMREFRIFCASNAVAFALLGLVTLVRRSSTRQLLLPAIVLLGAVAVTASLYLFQQNWLHTIVFADYVGMGYVLYLLTVALFLSDVAFNRARCTGHILHAIGTVTGGVVSVASC